MAGTLKLGRRGKYIELGGDSVSALTWAAEERFRGWRATSAAVAFTQEAAAGQIDAVGAHVAAEYNWRADHLSRRDLWGSGGTARSVFDGFREEYRRAPVIELEGDPHVAELLPLCRPTQGFGSEAQFMRTWRRAAAASHALAGQPRPGASTPGGPGRGGGGERGGGEAQATSSQAEPPQRQCISGPVKGLLIRAAPIRRSWVFGLMNAPPTGARAEDPRSPSAGAHICSQGHEAGRRRAHSARSRRGDMEASVRQ
jgi:hypothetical protein